ncbi:hypothetical protein SAMN05661096_00436 [Marivirga sericea]|uniref:Uncharacterized protein n=1 Tax=Marivirga sericea TaxID=1028 RepID=A0A1X7IC52_9BACT|nr:hypothetical protein [Marivirga sericea]SMG11742.1 hypothetical protein SAMN05661096_00436 [Marivirga sericea]
MNYTNYEHTVIKELEKRAGDVLYLKDVAPYFISKSCLQISTYTQTAYIQVGDNMQAALSEYFQMLVFLKKLEENGSCFSIPYTPLEDNLVQFGNSDYCEFQQNTIADGDLLIQLFQYANKKYVIAPNASDQFNLSPKKSKINFIIPSFILLLLFIFIGSIAYQSYLDSNRLKLQQQAVEANLKEQTLKIGLLSDQIQVQKELQNESLRAFQSKIDIINSSLENQNKTLRIINYWNQKQSVQIADLLEVIRYDSLQ